MKMIQAVLFALALALPAAAQDAWLRNEQAYSGKDAATSGTFATLQVATTEPDQFMADWETPGAGVRLVAARRVTRGRPIVTFILFRGCQTDRRGVCNVTVDFKTTDPAGKPYDSSAGVEVWVGRPPPPGRSIQLSAGALGLAFEAKDRLGDYVVKARVTDHVSGVTLETEKTLTLVAD